MKMTSKMRILGLGLIIVMLPFAAIILQAQEILGTTGAPMGGLEPWDEPFESSQRDRGIMHRVNEMLRKHLESLNDANAAIGDARNDGWIDSAQAAMLRRQKVCEDILAVIGIVKRHNSEIREWQLGASRGRYVLDSDILTPKALETLAEAAADSHDSLSADGDPPVGSERPGVPWPYLVAVWLPYEAAVEFNEEECQILNRLGLSIAVWEDDHDLSLCALFTLLQQVELDTSGCLALREPIREFVELTGLRYLEAYEMGVCRVDAGEVAVILDSCVGRNDVCRLQQDDFLDESSLALGSYVYPVVRQIHAARCAESSTSPIARSLLQTIVCGKQAAEVVESYRKRAWLFVSLAADLQTRLLAGDEQNPTQTAKLYHPFLWTLAHSVPCLSPFRPDARTDRIVAFASGWGSAQPGGSLDLWVAERKLNQQLREAGIEPECYLFLLQADYEGDVSGDWSWSPRTAGFRGFLIEHQQTRDPQAQDVP